MTETREQPPALRPFCSRSAIPPFWTGLGASLLLALWLLAFLSSCAGMTPAGSPSSRPPRFPVAPPVPDRATQVRVSEAYGKLPLGFEVNRGQTDAQVKFLSRSQGSRLFLTSDGAVLSLVSPQSAPGARRRKVDLFDRDAPLPAFPPLEVRMKLLGANPRPQVSGLEELPGKTHYLLGNDPKKWYTGLPTYSRVMYGQVYPGIDLLYYGNQQELEYDFMVAPGADPRAIVLGFAGADRLELDGQGDLVLHTAGGGQLLLRAPRIYQEIDGARRAISGNYLFLGCGKGEGEGHLQRVGFQVGPYDVARPLVIDPVLAYATYLGGSDTDVGFGIAVDGAGNAYVTGGTVSTNFPTRNPLEPDHGGGMWDAFVAKLDATGSLLYATYLGGSGDDFGFGIAVDGAGNAYVTGGTNSPDFPIVHPLPEAHGGGYDDAFVAKLDPSGSSLLYATSLGGSSLEEGHSIAVDAAGNAYVTGRTVSTDFPTRNPLQPALGGYDDAFVAKLDASGSSLLYATYLGGGNTDVGNGIAVDAAGNAYMTGWTVSTDFPTRSPLQPVPNGDSDLFVAKLDASGSSLLYATSLGGSADDRSHGIAVDAAGNAYVTGWTVSADFPTRNPLQPAHGGGHVDAFVAKLDASGSSLLYATYLGGNNIDVGNGIAADAAGNACVTGWTVSTNFPTRNPLQPAPNGDTDLFVAKLDASGSSLLYATYLGGSSEETGNGIAVDAAGNAYVTGWTWSPDFPTPNARQRVPGNPPELFFARTAADTRLTAALQARRLAAPEVFIASIAAGTPSGNPPVHDLAVTRITAPKRIILTLRKLTQTRQVKVHIQNRSPHDETLRDLAMLGNAVKLAVKSLGSCPAPAPVLHSGSPQRALPLTLKPKQTLEVIFDVTFECANDPAKSTPTSPGHEDYRYIATVNHAGLNGEADSHPEDDTCPRNGTLPFEVDPHPDGMIRDKGCGGQRPDGTLGEAVLTDVEER